MGTYTFGMKYTLMPILLYVYSSKILNAGPLLVTNCSIATFILVEDTTMSTSSTIGCLVEIHVNISACIHTHRNWTVIVYWLKCAQKRVWGLRTLLHQIAEYFVCILCVWAGERIEFKKIKEDTAWLISSEFISQASTLQPWCTQQHIKDPNASMKFTFKST